MSTQTASCSSKFPKDDDDDDDETTTSSSSDCCCYYCVHCLQPCPSLYKTLGAKNNSRIGRGGLGGVGVIKLTPCDDCGRLSVDPYCEREWLLVVLDLVLLRRAAYRHVYWNRGRLLAELSTAAAASDTTTTSPTTTTTVNKNHHKNALHSQIPRFLVAAVLLRAHIGMVSTQDRVDAEHTRRAVAGFVQLAAISLAGYAVQIAALAVMLNNERISSNSNQHNHTTSNSNQRQGFDHPEKPQRNKDSGSLLRVVALTVLLPAVADQMVTALALLWENSDTVRTLGSLLVLVHQYLSVYTVLEVVQLPLLRRHGSKTGAVASNNRKLLLLVGTTALFLLLALLLRALAMVTMAEAMIQAAAPCPGLAMKLFFDNSGRALCFA